MSWSVVATFNLIEMFQAGELQTLIKEVAAKHKQDDAAAE